MIRRIKRRWCRLVHRRIRFPWGAWGPVYQCAVCGELHENPAVNGPMRVRRSAE
jgi:hypothetical protein